MDTFDINKAYLSTIRAMKENNGEPKRKYDFLDVYFYIMAYTALTVNAIAFLFFTYYTLRLLYNAIFC
jgi:hypothetical protein